MKNNFNWIEESSNAKSQMQEISYRLDSLARSFLNIGMDSVSTELSQMSEDIEKSKDALNDCLSTLQNEYSDSVRSSTADLLSLALHQATTPNQHN